MRFFAPDVAFTDAERYLPSLLEKRGRHDADVHSALEYLQLLVEPIECSLCGIFENEARQRLRGRDEEDWPVLASALVLGCGIWTEDTDFFGTGVAGWNAGSILIFLQAQVDYLENYESNLPE